MTKHFGAVLLAVLAAVPAWAFGAEDPARPQAAAAAPTSQLVQISGALYFLEIALDLRDGRAVYGRLTGATSGSIRVQTEGREQEYALTDIRRVVIDAEPQRSRGILPGMVFGLYAGNGAIVSAFRRPGFYAGHVDGSSFGSPWFWLGQSFFAAMGGGLGWLAHFGGGRRVFEFPADLDKIPAASVRFAKFLAGESAPARVHVLIQGGFLLSGLSRRFGAFAADNGFAQSFPRLYPTNFSLLRGLELSYSIRPRWRTGLRLSFPSEPAFEFYMKSDEAVGTWASLEQELRNTAVHAIGIYELAGWKDRSGLAASAGLGAGLALIRLSRRAVTLFPNGYPDYIDATAEVRKALPSAVVFGNVRYRLTPLLSIGLAADFIFTPAVTVPALPDNGVAGGSQGLSNGSLGFIIGYHF